MRLIIAICVLLSASIQVFANDSEAEFAVGGLALKQSEAVSLDSEDLYISRDAVRVDYTFTNTSGKDVETLVAFPLPDQAYVPDIDNFYRDLQKDLDFKTTVDGKTVNYEVVVQPIFKEQDISAKLKAAGLPLNGLEDTDAFSAQVAALPPATRKALLAEGLVDVNGEGAEAYYWTKWVLRTSITRKQIFPAGKTVSVHHSYKPLAGGSVGGGLSAEYRRQDWGQQQLAKYCVEKSWLKRFDKEVPKHVTNANPTGYNEVWLGYVLKSGANWKGPIKDFRLLIDKGKADSLVSFCGDGIKKISPTQFEMRKKNFEPANDLNILIVDWWKPE